MAQESEELAQLRMTVRQWCAENRQPRAPDDQSEEDFVKSQQQWFASLRAAGWAAPHWPSRWGGAELGLAERIVLFEELTKADAPRLTLNSVAIYHAGSTLLEMGSPEQQDRHLPAIMNGTVWCQGFSEPNAGSDLAALRTRAVRDGDCYVVNGQKTWSSMAAHANWCLLLVRTDPDAPKRKGITFLLVDLASPGVERRRIRKANGQAEFCEIFFDDVSVPVANRVGQENDGWRIAQTTLSTERGTFVMELAERLSAGFEQLVAQARAHELGRGRSALDDPAVREQLAALHSDIRLVQLLCRRMLENMVRLGRAGPEASVIKICFSETLARLNEVALSILGPLVQRHGVKPLWTGWSSGRWLLDSISAFEWTIGGGTNEIQRTVIGERVLGLPRDPGTE